jgi:hypothetical protein
MSSCIDHPWECVIHIKIITLRQIQCVWFESTHHHTPSSHKPCYKIAQANLGYVSLNVLCQKDFGATFKKKERENERIYIYKKKWDGRGREKDMCHTRQVGPTSLRENIYREREIAPNPTDSCGSPRWWQPWRPTHSATFGLVFVGLLSELPSPLLIPFCG